MYNFKTIAIKCEPHDHHTLAQHLCWHCSGYFAVITGGVGGGGEGGGFGDVGMSLGMLGLVCGFVCP